MPRDAFKDGITAVEEGSIADDSDCCITTPKSTCAAGHSTPVMVIVPRAAISGTMVFVLLQERWHLQQRPLMHCSVSVQATTKEDKRSYIIGAVFAV